MTTASIRTWIGLDLGTSAVKGVLLDSRGSVLATAGREVPYQYPGEGWVEGDPEAHWTVVWEVIRSLAAQSPVTVAAIAASGASGNTLLCDRDGHPLTPILNWMDQRCVGSRPPSIGDLSPEEVREVVGWPIVESFPLAHLAWFREHRSGDYARAERVCMNTDWFLHRLSGEWVMDRSTATTFHLCHQEQAQWYPPFLERLGLRSSQLSRLTESGRAVGPLQKQWTVPGLTTETLMVTGSFDHPSAARATGILDPGSLMLSCGSSWVGFVPLAERRKVLEAHLLCDPFLSGDGGPWAGMFAVPRIGPVIDDYVTRVIAPGEADPYAVFNAAAAAAPPGADGLTIDLREPAREHQASPAAISRAVMEGAVRLLAEKLDELKGHGITFEEAVLVGGPSKSRIWPDLIASGMGLRLRVGNPHAGALGAAFLAAIGSGAFASEREIPSSWMNQ